MSHFLSHLGVQKEMARQILERYDVFSKESLYQAIQNGEVAGHPAWEDYIVWKNKEAHIAPGSFSGEIANRGNIGKTSAVLRHRCEQGAEK